MCLLDFGGNFTTFVIKNFRSRDVPHFIARVHSSPCGESERESRACVGFKWENQSLSHTLSTRGKKVLPSFFLARCFLFNWNAPVEWNALQASGTNRFHLEKHFLIFPLFLFIFYCRVSFLGVALYLDLLDVRPTFLFPEHQHLHANNSFTPFCHQIAFLKVFLLLLLFIFRTKFASNKKLSLVQLRFN